MTGPESGFLLLSCRLGNPERKVLTTAQLRTLTQRMRDFRLEDPDRDLVPEDLIPLGYSMEMARRIVALLDDRALLLHCLRRARRADCVPLSLISPLYPKILRHRLGEDAPGCLWAKGDLDLLNNPLISLVGSRELNPENSAFAREAGRQAALQGYTLVSGNARGSDRTAQDACLEAGGKVISIVADSLENHPLRNNVLYLSEDDFDGDFSAQRALSRNRCIHALGEKVLVAQSGCGQGGTWDGTVKNLRFRWSDVFCFADGSPGTDMLCRMGANGVTVPELADLKALAGAQDNFLGR